MLSSLISFPSPIALLAGSLLAALVWGFWRTDVLTIAPGCTDYFCKLREKHFVREERSGFNGIAQDWWREVQRQPDGSFKMTGAWLKHNGGYFPRSHLDTWPFVPVKRA